MSVTYWGTRGGRERGDAGGKRQGGWEERGEQRGGVTERQRWSVSAHSSDPPHSLQVALCLCLCCSQIDDPPHSLHFLLCLLCSQIAHPPHSFPSSLQVRLLCSHLAPRTLCRIVPCRRVYFTAPATVWQAHWCSSLPVDRRYNQNLDQNLNLNFRSSSSN